MDGINEFFINQTVPSEYDLIDQTFEYSSSNHFFY